jgi:hypothetical protein
VTHTTDGVTWESPEYSFWVTIMKSPKPSAVVVPNPPPGQEVTFTWNTYASATSYIFYFFFNEDCSGGGGPGSTTATSYTVGPVTPGVYSWRVTPVPGPQMPCWSFTAQ